MNLLLRDSASRNYCNSVPSNEWAYVLLMEFSAVHIAIREHVSVRLMDVCSHNSRHRRCPYCHGAVRREKRKGLSNLTLMLAIRPYRCVDCDRLHYGFCF